MKITLLIILFLSIPVIAQEDKLSDKTVDAQVKTDAAEAKIKELSEQIQNLTRILSEHMAQDASFRQQQAQQQLQTKTFSKEEINKAREQYKDACKPFNVVGFYRLDKQIVTICK